MQKVNIFWFRRDLRLEDNAGLYHALKSGEKVQPIFIFDQHILSQLENKSDLRVNFIHQTIKKLQEQLKEFGSNLNVFYGETLTVFQELTIRYRISKVFTNRDYEPSAIKRDKAVKDYLSEQKIDFKTSKDHVIFEYNEVLKDDETPYAVFTPYSRKWKAKLNDFYLKSYPTEKYFDNFNQQNSTEVLTLKSIGFEKVKFEFPKIEVQKSIIKKYSEQRDFPSINGTSKLGLHYRFGTISIREKARKAGKLNETYLNELIWRDFYSMILGNHPRVVKEAYRPICDQIEWRNDEQEFAAWCAGKTGYPLVDAGIRELNKTGHMHNRVRMVVASFLCKHLLIDWRWGEAYFAEKLLDFDLASNNGGWQWAAGCGCDAAPYFRVFNPELQQKKFDKELKYIKKWVPEIENPFKYPTPIVDHKFARERALSTYKSVLKRD